MEFDLFFFFLIAQALIWQFSEDSHWASITIFPPCPRKQTTWSKLLIQYKCIQSLKSVLME